MEFLRAIVQKEIKKSGVEPVTIIEVVKYQSRKLSKYVVIMLNLISVLHSSIEQTLGWNEIEAGANCIKIQSNTHSWHH